MASWSNKGEVTRIAFDLPSTRIIIEDVGKFLDLGVAFKVQHDAFSDEATKD